LASVNLTAEPRSVRDARVFVAEAMSAVGMSSSLALLLTSELASNVVQHARTTFELVVEVRPGLVHVELHDGVAITIAFRELIERHPGAPEMHVVSGRGLMLLTSSAASCGVVDKGPEGKAVWFDVHPELE
jgi:anti-sigma regulatory factor (Ser/Thr protein kinase)